jgi:hypothetical protein
MRGKLLRIAAIAAVLAALAVGFVSVTGSRNRAEAGQLALGTPASLTFLTSPTTVTCGSVSQISVSVADSSRNPIGSNVPVTFKTTIGTIITNSYSSPVVAALIVPVKTSGQAVITVTAGSVTATQNVNITCATR